MIGSTNLNPQKILFMAVTAPGWNEVLVCWITYSPEALIHTRFQPGEIRLQKFLQTVSTTMTYLTHPTCGLRVDWFCVRVSSWFALPMNEREPNHEITRIRNHEKTQRVQLMSQVYYYR